MWLLDVSSRRPQPRDWNPDWANDTLNTKRTLRKGGRRGTLPDATPLVPSSPVMFPNPRGLHRPKQCQALSLVLLRSSPEAVGCHSPPLSIPRPPSPLLASGVVFSLALVTRAEGTPLVFGIRYIPWSDDD